MTEIEYIEGRLKAVEVLLEATISVLGYSLPHTAMHLRSLLEEARAKDEVLKTNYRMTPES